MACGDLLHASVRVTVVRRVLNKLDAFKFGGIPSDFRVILLSRALDGQSIRRAIWRLYRAGHNLTATTIFKEDEPWSASYNESRLTS